MVADGPGTIKVRSLTQHEASCSSDQMDVDRIIGQPHAGALPELRRDATALPRHRDLGFRFIGLGSDGAFIFAGARAALAAARA
jgi:hypothetical protein